MEPSAWPQRLHELYDKSVAAYRSGNRSLAAYFSEEDCRSLSSMGLRPIHLYDFAEDFTGSGEPDWDTALLIMAARRDYFLRIQNGVPNTVEISAQDLPSKEAELGGIPWLPRLIKKARCFLEGVHCREIMYCCGGDRRFFRTYGIHPADFLLLVGAAPDDDARILKYVQAARSA